MKIRHKGERIEVEVEGDGLKDCMAELAGALEVFSNSVCGACDSHNTAPSVRDVQGNRYYEMRCKDCGATLGFGQKKADGTLFPKRKDKSDAYLPGNGWVRWTPKPDLADEAF